LATLFGLLSANVCFDGIEFSDSTKRFLGHLGFMRHHQVVELSAHVRPASRFLNASRLVNLLETRVRIGLQHSGKVAQVLFRMFPFAIR
jgi:hypothetical protein